MKSPNPIEAYIETFAQNLRVSNKADLIRELKDVLLSDLEGRMQAAPNANLNDTMSLLIAGRQPADELAACFSKEKTLVSSNAFPVFAIALKWSIFMSLVLIGAAFVTDAQLTVHAWIRVAGSLALSACIVFTVITVVFHFLDYKFPDLFCETRAFGVLKGFDLPAIGARYDGVSALTSLLLLSFLNIWPPLAIPVFINEPDLHVAWVSIASPQFLGYPQLLSSVWIIAQLVLIVARRRMRPTRWRLMSMLHRLAGLLACGALIASGMLFPEAHLLSGKDNPLDVFIANPSDAAVLQLLLSFVLSTVILLKGYALALEVILGIRGSLRSWTS